MRRNLLKVWKAIGFLKAGNQPNKEAISKPKSAYFDTTTNDLTDECYNSWMVSCHLSIYSFNFMPFYLVIFEYIYIDI